ncbi:MAG: pentapeptide repeat-containing protein [Cyanobacteriota bacterium]|nr:pentapeptide repeat-containing protein [Cyanobacteriota bacterium]
MATRLWKFLTTDIRDLCSTDTVDSAIATFDAIASLAETLEEEGSNIQQLVPLINRIDSLLDILNSSLFKVINSSLPFVSIATGLLKFYLETTKQKPTLEKTVALVSQAAYLESLQAILKLPVYQDLLQRDNSRVAQETTQLDKQLRRLASVEVDEKEARKAIVCFPKSKLAVEFSNVLSLRLQQASWTDTEVQHLTQRVAWNTHRHLSKAWSASGDIHLTQPAFSDWREEQERYHSIDEYLEAEIAAKPLEAVFAENFTFKDIYVPLKVKSVDKNGKLIEDAPTHILENWAIRIIHAEDKKEQVMFVQGGPGRGKSVFCRMFADWVRQHLHPVWTPVLIRLRDINTFEKNFEQTLRAAVNTDFAKNDDGWLTDQNTRYLFLLDGFDELRMEGRTTGGIEQFLKQVGSFQRNCAESSQFNHRVLITGRELALQGIERFMPPNLERVEIQPLEEGQQAQWLEKWARLTEGESPFAIGIFQDGRLPEQVQKLKQEPLLLYLMAAMHRDNELNLEKFEGTTKVEAKVLLYQKMLDWVLTKQRPQWLNQELTELQIEGLRRILAEAGLCVMQSGGEVASISAIERRLQGDDNAKMLLETAQQRLGEMPLRNALTSFYLRPGSQEGSVEFAHKSFGEFLCAERLTVHLESWSLKGGRRYQEFEVSTEQMYWEIYDLLGAAPLTPEIVEYLMQLLSESNEFSESENVVRLFKRLEQFYFLWSEGRFIDAPPGNFTQKKMWLLQKEMGLNSINIGARQIDTYAGLNIMILLLELERYSYNHDSLKEKITFYLCGDPETRNFDRRKLLRIVGYSQCCGALTFTKVMGKFFKEKYIDSAIFAGIELISPDFSSSKLNRVYFSRAYLLNANFSGADIKSTDYSGAYLNLANFRAADLTDSRFKGADLTGADFRKAKLCDTDFRGADLCCTKLEGTNLKGANVAGADLVDILWDEDTNWEGVQGLETAVNVPEALKRKLGLA